MRLLLDTHALLWWLFDDPKLPTTAREVIGAPANDVYVSAASAWEISTKHRLGKLPEAGDVATDIKRYIREARFRDLPISVEHARMAGALPGPHRDPFDRMLIAQAQLDQLHVVSRDPVFADYAIPVVW